MYLHLRLEQGLRIYDLTDQAADCKLKRIASS